MSSKALDPQELDYKNLPLNGVKLIEASAGTGKTWTIAALYLRLVLEQELLPDQILVVTFTEAATAELRDRIRRRLAEAARYFRGELDKADPLLTALRNDYSEQQWPVLARRLEQAMQLMDEAAIHTIHGWCRRMLHKYAFDSGNLFDFELSQSDTEIYDEAVRDYWRVHIYPLSATVSQLIRSIWPNPTALGKALRPWLSECSELPETRPYDRYQSLEDKLTEAKRIWRAHRAEFEPALREAYEAGRMNGNKVRQGALDRWLDAMAVWSEQRHLLKPKEEGACKNLTQSGLAGVMKKNQSPPESPAFRAFEDWLTALDALDPEADILPHAAQWVARVYEQEKQRRVQMSFEDLLTRLADALDQTDSPLPAVIREQYPVAMIDEFQDTDPVQYRIFERVYMQSPPGTLLMIGDPKQAIYAFRGADIYTYLKARRATAGHHYTLKCNFRSTEAMVKATHHLFSYADQHPAGAFLFRREQENPVPFTEVSANGRDEQLEVEARQLPALTLWLDEGEVSGEPISKGEYIARMSKAAANEIARLLSLGREQRAGFRHADGSFRALTPADIAILVRDGYEASAIRSELEARGVRSVYLSDNESVFKSDEARDVLYWLRACAEPQNESLIRAALATATLQQSWHDLERFNNDERHWEAIVERFQRYQQIWSRRGVLPMLRRLLNDWDVPARLLARADGERRLTNLLHLAERLQAVQGEQEGEQALIRHLNDEIAGRESAHDEEDRILRLESDDKRVRVITIHKSKGLEYMLVFLPFIGTFKRVDPQKGPVIYHDEAGHRHLVSKPDQALLALADRERLAEDMRLLYVAITRACHACWMGLAPMVNGQKKQETLLRCSAIGYLLNGDAGDGDLAALVNQLASGCAQIAVAKPPIDDFTVLPREAVDSDALAPAREYHGPAFEPWWIASYSALRRLGERYDGSSHSALSSVAETRITEPETARQAILQEAVDDRPGDLSSDLVSEDQAKALPSAELIFPAGFPRGPVPGTFLHGLLEWAAEEGFAKVASEPALREEQLARRCHIHGWSDWRTPLADWLGSLLVKPLPLPEGGSLALASISQWQAEMEFWFSVRQVDAQALDRLVIRHSLAGTPRPAIAPAKLNGMLKGFIDLVFEHKGRYYIVDYKSNDLGPTPGDYERAALQQAILENRYDLQYLLYTLALHRLLRTRLPDYDYETHMGGVMYLFLRGIDGSGRGVFTDRPAAALIEAMDALFAGRMPVLSEEGGVKGAHYAA